jgi:hypothetical protein
MAKIKYLVATKDDLDIFNNLEQAKKHALEEAQDDVDSEFLVWEIKPIGVAAVAKPTFEIIEDDDE